MLSLRAAQVASLVSALVLVMATPATGRQEGEPIPEEELPAFLGPVPPDQFAWRIVNGPDFVVYSGKPNPPLAGSTGFYLGFAPQDLEPGSTVRSRLGRFKAKWHRNVDPDGSIRQEAIISLGGVLDTKAHVWAEAPNEDQLQKLLSALGQLPVFSSRWIPARFQSLQDDLAEEQRIRRLIWISWCTLVLAGSWLVDRVCRRRSVSAVRRLIIFAGMIAASIGTTIAALALLPVLCRLGPDSAELGGSEPEFVPNLAIHWFHKGNGLLLFAAAGIVLVSALLLAGGLSLLRLFRARKT